MARVYSTELVALAGTTGTVDYVPPAGYITVVRCMDLFCGSQPVQPIARVLGHAGQVFFYCGGSTLTSTWFPWRGRQVLEAGEGLSVVIDDGNFDITISGYLLEAP